MKNILFISILFSLSAFAQPKAKATITVAGTTAVLSSTGSTGAIDYNWQATPTVAWLNGVYYGAANVTATIKPNTVYTFKLIAQDKYGKKDTAVVNYSPAPVVVKPIGRTDTLYQYFMYSDSSKLKLRIIVWKDYTTTNINQ